MNSLCFKTNKGLSAILLLSLMLVACGGGSGVGYSGAPADNNAGSVPPSPPSTTTPTVSLSAAAASIAYNANTNINWSSTNSTSCTSPAGGGTGTTGSFNTGALTTTTTYTVTCVGAVGSANKSITITVVPPVNAGCSPTGAIALSNVPSRLTGVAPLSVFFDASATTATATTRPFHDLEYRWNFGDTTGSPVRGTAWNQGSKAGVNSRNTAIGPEAAHVFETPGVYNVVVNATDGTNTVTNSCAQIVVQDPDTVFNGTNTICIGASAVPVAGVGGCPSGAAVYQQSNFATAVNTYIATGKRLLFKRGDTFASSTPATIAVAGPGTIGAYGTGANPIVSLTGSVNAIDLSRATTPTSVSDWRIMDLEINGNSGNGAGVNGVGAATKITILRLNVHHAGFGLELSHYSLDYFNTHGNPGHTLWEQFTVQDSTFSTLSNYGVYASAGYFAIMGNSMNSANLHVVRLPQIAYGVISNNSLATQGAGYAVLRIDGPNWCPESQTITSCNYTNDSVPTDSQGYHGGYTDLVVESDNLLTSTTAGWVNNEIGPSNSAWDSRIRNVIVERNFITQGNFGLDINAQDITVRNNIFRIVPDANGLKAIGVQKRGPGSVEPPPLRVNLYNNTIYSTGNIVGIGIDASATATTIKNNVAYAPNGSSTQMINDAGSTNLTASNNSSDSQVKGMSPLFTNATGTMSTPDDFKPTGSSYAIGINNACSGIPCSVSTGIPLWSDFQLGGIVKTVPATRDMGAVIH